MGETIETSPPVSGEMQVIFDKDAMSQVTFYSPSLSLFLPKRRAPHTPQFLSSYAHIDSCDGPNPPKSINITEITNNSSQVSWVDDSKEATAYEISYRQDSNEEKEGWTTVNHENPQKKTLKLSKLIQKTPYSLKIRGKNEKGKFGTYSKLYKFIT